MSTRSSYSCPRCRAYLQCGQYQHVDIDLCLQCNGLMVKLNRLVTLLQSAVDDLDQPIDIDAVLEPVPDKGAHNSCPQCSRIMENYGYMETKYVMIDACGSCGVVWIDADELGPMSWIHARAQKRSEDIQRRGVDDRRDMIRRFNALRASRAMADRIAARML